MTDEKIQTLKDDIAFMKALAQEGGSAPLLGGSILVAAGLIFGAASVVHWAVVTGVLAVSPWAFPDHLVRRPWSVPGRPGHPQPPFARPAGANSPGNRATGVAWAAVGWTIFVIGVSLMIIAVRTRSEAVMLVFPSLILGLYGMGWSVAAAMSGKRWIRMTAIGAYAATLLVAWFAAEPAVYLAYAGALVLLAALPGYVLMRQEPATTI